jgi:hemerythrin-like domain-containing protein
MNRFNTIGVRETRLVHEVHRQATSLLAEIESAAGAHRHPAPLADEFRDFVAAMLEHHHTREDRDLWPMLVDRAPHLARALDELTGEHDRLQRCLDSIESARGDGRAAALRDLVHEHLAHEEPMLFPALDRYVRDADWTAFSKRTIASSPRDGVPFLLALIDEVGTADDAELIFRQLPPEARAAIPARRADGRRALAELRTPLRAGERVR